MEPLSSAIRGRSVIRQSQAWTMKAAVVQDVQGVPRKHAHIHTYMCTHTHTTSLSTHATLPKVKLFLQRAPFVT